MCSYAEIGIKVQFSKSANASVSFGAFLMRIRTAAWKAITAFRAYVQGPEAMTPCGEEYIVCEPTNSRLA